MSAPKSTSGRSLGAAATAAAVAAYGAVALWRPGGLHIVPPCPLRSLTGLDCPLCGATRATRALVLDLDLPKALDLNALYVVGLAVAAVALAVRWRRGRLPGWLTHRLTLPVVGAIALAFAVVRNLPVEPFRYLGT